MAYKIQNRNDTAANWTAANPTLAQGEIGLETNTRKFKIGDGATAWTSLAYGVASGSVASSDITQVVSDKSANYTIVATDKGSLIRSTNSAITITIANVLAVGETINFAQWGTGQVTFAAGSGVTLGSKGSLVKTTGQYSGVSVQCVASGVYWLVGDLA